MLAPRYLLFALTLGLSAGSLVAARADTPPPIEQWPAKPQPGAPVDFKKPANYIQTADYTLRLETTPHVIQVGEPVTIDLDLLTPDATNPLDVDEPYGAPVHLIVMDKHGDRAIHLEPSATTSGHYEANLTIPYSGEHIIYVVFQPAGKAIMRERFPVWVENIAVNGKDTTSYRNVETPGMVGSEGTPAGTIPAKHHFVESKGYQIDFAPGTDYTVVSSSGTPLRFQITQNGQAVGDLEPTMVWVVPTASENIYFATPSADRSTWLITFPGEGRYQVWAEYSLSTGDTILVPLSLDYGHVVEIAPTPPSNTGDQGPGVF